MRVSIIIPVLNSHEIVRRQLIHYRKMNLPNDVEIIFVDDGSDPPIEYPSEPLNNFRIITTHDTREWTWALARNRGAKESSGEYLIMTDLDYIIPKETIEFVRNFNGQYMGFRRELGVLDENGNFTQGREALIKYGISPKRYDENGARLPAHTNNFALQKQLFFDMGGYREDRIGMPYPQREDGDWRKKRKQWQASGKLTLLPDTDRPMIYMFPNGRWCGDVDYNPFDLFHTLSRKSGHNPWDKHA